MEKVSFDRNSILFTHFTILCKIGSDSFYLNATGYYILYDVLCHVNADVELNSTETVIRQPIVYILKLKNRVWTNDQLKLIIILKKFREVFHFWKENNGIEFLTMRPPFFPDNCVSQTLLLLDTKEVQYTMEIHTFTSLNLGKNIFLDEKRDNANPFILDRSLSTQPD